MSERCKDINLGEIQELTDTTPEELTEDNWMEMSACEPVPDDEEEDVEEIVSGKHIDIRQSDRRAPAIQDCF